MHGLLTNDFAGHIFTLVQFKVLSMHSERFIIMRSAPTFGSVPNIAFETFPMCV